MKQLFDDGKYIVSQPGQGDSRAMFGITNPNEPLNFMDDVLYIYKKHNPKACILFTPKGDIAEADGTELRELARDPKLVEFILDTGSAKMGKYLMDKAVANNDIAELTKLLNDHRVEINPEAILTAIEVNAIDIVKLLLADERIDPEYKNNRAIRNAVYFNRPEIVKILLDDGRVDPAAADLTNIADDEGPVNLDDLHTITLALIKDSRTDMVKAMKLALKNKWQDIIEYIKKTDALPRNVFQSLYHESMSHKLHESANYFMTTDLE